MLWYASRWLFPVRSRLPVNRIKRPAGYDADGPFTFIILYAVPVLPVLEP